MIGDSTATVIGAMIVAPLMTPILGIALAIVLTDRANLARSLGLVAGGAAAVVGLAWVMGHLVSLSVVAATSTQVSARVQPRLIDLIAALATGAVGAIALARSDISDTLPGVAIAISLVPPLAVVGLTLESGATTEAAGALLFGTNVAAILFSGIVVMAVYRVSTQVTTANVVGERRRRRGAVALVVAAVAAVAVPLAVTSSTIGSQAIRTQDVTEVANAWAEAGGWRVIEVERVTDGYRVRAAGPLPEPATGPLRAELDEAGLAAERVRLELVPERLVTLEPGD